MGLNTDQGRSNRSKKSSPGRANSGEVDTSPGVEDGKTLIDGMKAIPKSSDVTTDVGKNLPPEDDPRERAAPLPLQRAMREVEATVDAQLVGTLERIERLRKKEEALQEQLEQLYLELGNVQDALQGTATDLKGTLGERKELCARRYELQARSLQRTMLTDAADLRHRAALWKSRMDEADARVRAFKENPDLAKQIEEFRRLDERMDTLELLPESYRGVLQQHHTDLKTKLQPHLEEPIHAEPPLLRLAVAVGVVGGRRPDGEEAGEDTLTARLLAVLPVDFATHARAKQGKSDLAARFAFRVLAALSRFVVNIGARSDPQPADLDGLLGIQLPFDDLAVPVTAGDLARALRDSFAEAADSQMAKVRVTTDMVFVPIETLDLLWAKTAESEETKDDAKPTRSKSKRSRGK